MALNEEFFDSIHIDVVKKKYYNANKVDALLSEIRSQALTISEDNRQMHEILDGVTAQKMEIGEAVLSANNIAQRILADANEKADAMLKDANEKAGAVIADAEKKRGDILNASASQQNYAVQQVEQCYSRMREQHMACIEALNEEWREFLCGLYSEDKPDFDDAPIPDSTDVNRQSADLTDSTDVNRQVPDLPDDLKEKISAILHEMDDIGNKEAE